MAKDTQGSENTNKSGESSRIPLADRMKKMSDGLKIRTYEEVTEDRGGPLETSEVESAGQVVARYVHKDGKLVESAATTDAQQNGTHQKAAKRLGDKEDDLTYTGTDMVTAQAATREHNSAPKSSDSAQPRGEKEEKRTDPRESESAKLVGAKKQPKEPSKLKKADDSDKPTETKTKKFGKLGVAPQPKQEPAKPSAPQAMWDVLGRRKKPVEPGGSGSKIRAALAAQADTNPYAQPAEHTGVHRPTGPIKNPAYEKALSNQRNGTKSAKPVSIQTKQPTRPEEPTPPKDKSHLKLIKSDGRANMDRLLQTIRMHLKDRPAATKPAELDENFKQRLASITKPANSHQEYAQKIAQRVRNMSAKPNVEVQDHPPEVIDVDPKILANMKQRLENTKKSAAPVQAGQLPAQSAYSKDPLDKHAANPLAEHAKTLHDADLGDMMEVLIEEKLKRRNAQPSLHKSMPMPLTKDDEAPARAKTQSYRLLTDEGSNAKTAKNQSRGNYLSAILHLAPAGLAGCGNVCPASSEGCRQSCLNTAGRGGMFKDPKDAIIQKARIARTKMMFKEPEKFWKNLNLDIEKVKRLAAAEGRKPLVRLNGTSDLSWEDLKPHELGGKNVFEAHPDVQFYDYTKRPDRVMRNKHQNYHLTFSRSEANEGMAKRLLGAGHNVAVVFGGKQLPANYLGHPVVSGDEHDLRFLDPRDKGHVIGLTAKGDAKHDSSGFVVWGHEGDPTAQSKPQKQTKYQTLIDAPKEKP